MTSITRTRVAFDGNTATLSDDSTMDVDTALVEKTTKTRALAVILRDAGKTNAEIGVLMGTTAGSAGNNVTNGLRDLGREGEITASNGGGGSGTRSVNSDPVSVAEGALERAREAKANLGDTVKKAEGERKAFLADMKTKGLDIAADSSPVMDVLRAHHDRLDTKVKNAKDGIKTRQVELDHTITKWEAAITALKAVA